jgi:hypothetical protein
LGGWPLLELAQEEEWTKATARAMLLSSLEENELAGHGRALEEETRMMRMYIWRV